MTPDLKPNTTYTVTENHGDFTVGKNYTTDSRGTLTDDDGFEWVYPVSGGVVKLQEPEEGFSRIENWGGDLEHPTKTTEDLPDPEFEWDHSDLIVHPDSLELEEGVVKPWSSSTGGPSSYYDFPFDQWVTTNDMVEYLAENKWGAFSVSFKDVFKALCRWGDKNGTSYEYDAKKIIYYGARVLRKIVGTQGLRSYLQELLDDEQFQND